jgi:tRNA-dihydrouridine synthase A
MSVLNTSSISAQEQSSNDWRFCVAPMIDVTDRHCRYFLRLLSQHTRLYTEMITCSAIIHGDQDHLLGFHDSEQPLAIQLGGSNPEQFAYCAPLLEQRGYNEININIGCPSERVQSGSFGACLMKEPKLVAECFQALTEHSSLPCTIKCRIGIDQLDNFEFLDEFIVTLANVGCNTFIIHARIAILSGLSPKENRSIPPLNYQRVLDIKNKYPELNIIINGGIQSLQQSNELLTDFDGVMLGREVYKNPFILNQVDSTFFKDKPPVKTRASIIKDILPYIEKQIENDVRPHSITRHLVGLFHEQKFGRHWRSFISANKLKASKDLDQLYQLALKIDSENLNTQTVTQINTNTETGINA